MKTLKRISTLAIFGLTLAPQHIASAEDRGILYARLSGLGFEVVDLNTMTTIKTQPPGSLQGELMEVAPGGSELYFLVHNSDFGGNPRVIVVSPRTGETLESIQLSGQLVLDLVLSPDGKTLYATSTDELAKIDIETYSKTESTTPSEFLRGLDLSPDGSTLAAVALPDTLILFDTETMLETDRITLTNPNGTPALYECKFTDTNRILVWDRGLNALYQVDLTTGSQVTEDTIETSVSGSTHRFSNQFVYSSRRSQAFTLDRSLDLTVLDPARGVSAKVPDVSGFQIAMNPDESDLYLATSSTLSRYNISSGNFQEDVYTFDNNIRDIKIIRDSRSGSVNKGAGPVTDVLFVNNQAREATVSVGESIELKLDHAPQGPVTDACYIVWIWAGEPTNPQFVSGLGTFANPTPFQFALDNQPISTIDGNLPRVFFAGSSFRGVPAKAPWTVNRSSGLPMPTTYTLQGVIQDLGSADASKLSSTNSVVVFVE